MIFDSVDILNLDLAASSERKRPRKITSKVLDSACEDEILRIPKKKVKSVLAKQILKRVHELLRMFIVCFFSLSFQESKLQGHWSEEAVVKDVQVFRFIIVQIYLLNMIVQPQQK